MIKTHFGEKFKLNIKLRLIQISFLDSMHLHRKTNRKENRVSFVQYTAFFQKKTLFFLKDCVNWENIPKRKGILGEYLKRSESQEQGFIF